MTSTPARTRRRPRSRLKILAIVTAITVAVTAALVALILWDPFAPATPEPDEIIPQPLGGNQVVLKGSDYVSLFGRFTYLQPSEKVWKTEYMKTGGILTYADVASCKKNAAAECSTISFIDLSSPEMKELFGHDPLKVWARDACQYAKGALRGSEEFDTDGETTRYYQVSCGSLDGHAIYAWYIPDKHLLVATASGDDGQVKVETVKLVMDSIRWK